MKAMIHKELERMNGIFQKYGIETEGFPDPAPSSLTALLLRDKEIAFFLLPNVEAWSLGHVLSAAKLLSSRGGSFLLWEEPVDRPALLTGVHEEAALEALLRPKPVVSTASTSGGPEPLPERYRAGKIIEPLDIPPGAVLLLGVVGSQRRIGCTTQAAALFHYCKSLGFSPAICQSPEALATLSDVCQGEKIDGGYRIEEIPFVTGTALAYDCYVLDLGAGPEEAALKACDLLVLVGGWKPWEVAETASAWWHLAEYPAVPVLSFLRSQDLPKYQPLFGGTTVYPAPYISGDPWQPNGAAMLAWDRILRTLLKAALERQEGENHDLQENHERDR